MPVARHTKVNQLRDPAVYHEEHPGCFSKYILGLLPAKVESSSRLDCHFEDTPTTATSAASISPKQVCSSILDPKGSIAGRDQV